MIFPLGPDFAFLFIAICLLILKKIFDMRSFIIFIILNKRMLLTQLLHLFWQYLYISYLAV